MSNNLEKPTVESKSRYHIPNLSNACRVLRLLAETESGLNLAAIRESLAIPHTSAMRILRTLEAEGFVQMEGRDFVLGSAFLQMGAQHFSGFNLRKAALPALKRLVEETGETAHFCVPSGYRSLILEVAESPSPVRAASRPGTLADLHCSATGKVFLAHLFMDKLEEVVAQQPLVKRTKKSITTLTHLRKELEEVRRQGFAVDDEEYHLGVRCLAAPVYALDGHVVGSIGVTAGTQRFLKKRIPSVAKAVKLVAEDMNVG